MAKKTGGIVSIISSCLNCPWENQDHINGREAARKHADKTGHKVACEVASAHTYYGGSS